MIDRQSVGSRYTELLLILLGFAVAVGVALTATAAIRAHRNTTIIAAVTVAVAVLFLFRWWLVARGRRWITLTETGFILESRHGTFEFADDEITDLATESAARYSDGVPKAMTRRGVITLLNDRVPFRYEHPLDHPDPLETFLQRVLTDLTDRAEDTLARDETLRGYRWELTFDGLTVRTGRRERYLDIENIAAVEVVGGEVCVWERGETRPSAHIPAGSANALVLLTLLDRIICERGTDPDEAVGGLGRVMFERGRSANPFVLLIITLMFASGGAALGAVAGGLRGAALGIGVFAVICSPVFLAVLLTAGNVFRCHARGVFRRTAWLTRELRFEDVGRFTYAATRSYYNGFYVGTSVRMSFSPRAGVNGRDVSFSISMKNGDDELSRLRDHVSRVVAVHQLQRLERGEKVKWTEGLRFSPEGLEWTSNGNLFTRPVMRLIPYDQILSTDIHEGHFSLYVRSSKKAVYTTPVSASNFFPGLAMLDAIRHPAESHN
ncbi:Uncharacterized protein OS=Blastopirellula marina DSM 3645 GN=DSM3645_24665 PE=4 SV=1 [Gemmata massiliana]|uniref:Uncharacterized protein n=1 Tax=Gemmata massiliana TaxID=1210884 RepID=A0A6P2D2S3_9BACT|nr:hypothetical protein [Gemmata massiliana]VTR94394.1 Uncharacterized protein OS=Blastopirellula marina DSM 3645 GN=DSM3645_24665 PE=4 SV=1 [Gemmata massiliana]